MLLEVEGEKSLIALVPNLLKPLCRSPSINNSMLNIFVSQKNLASAECRAPCRPTHSYNRDGACEGLLKTPDRLFWRASSIGS